MLALDDIESANTGANVDANHLRVFRRDLKLRGFEGLVGGGDGEVNEAAHLLHFFFFDEVQRVEVANLGGDLASIGGGIKCGDAADTALSGLQGLPDLAGRIAQGADQADAGDDNPPWQFICPPWRACRCSPRRRRRCESSRRPHREFRCRRLLQKP